MGAMNTREMPVIEVRQTPDRRYHTTLPGGIERVVAKRDQAEELVRREAPGSSVKFVAP